MPRKRTNRIYWKDGKAYADFRDHAAWGGRLEALKVPGTRSATTDADEAVRICARRLDELRAPSAGPAGSASRRREARRAIRLLNGSFTR
jgi:hypothetical protein